MIRHVSRRSALAVPLCLLVVLSGPLPAQSEIAAQVAEVRSRDGWWVVRCAGGEAMGFLPLSVQSVDGTTITFNPKRNGVMHAAMPAGLDTAQKRVFGEFLSLNMAPPRDSIGALAVTWTGPFFRRESPPCNAEEVLHTPVARAEFDQREFAFTNAFGGAKLGLMVLEFVKKPPKTKATSCLIRRPPANAAFPRIEPELEGAFLDAVKQHMSGRFDTVGFDEDPRPPGPARVLVFDAITRSRAPADFKNKPPYRLIDAVFHLVDTETGRMIWQGRSGFPIGDDQEKEIRKMATMFGCL